ncbi:hypothetical protein D187_008251 [Cystobacter fuscus DSM 2262]|uniref:Type VI secretion system baseplate subunit TssG n=1 Tax=Cystobacter fuscus (strain ATCC 25194 / DSM 2262 / NBRC 100088 / M29) TaxID=1242864 RepID=S9NYN7_CYSF2|nr:hypothetical protein [Cystobacter fuscus]EPX55996.1 hypothetical protein D187_008251 [Cystobacter fuscus DSM 2262]
MNGPIERRIRERIRGFDIPALLSVLAASGYGDAQIEYRSHRTTVHQSHLVHDIEFIREPTKRVIITVNMGLLSAQSPLPSFLMQTMDQLDHDRLERFVGYFDHLLLHECFTGLYPERDEALLPGWSQTVLDRLRMLRPTSPSTLHWLFAKIFPEVELSVRREVRQQRVRAREMRLGATTLGEGDSMGGFASIPTGGMEVKLYCDEPIASNGVAWAVEARHRFETELLPLLSESVFMLTVFLVLRDQASVLRTERDSYLGYDPLQEASNYTQQVLLFSGDTSSPPETNVAVWNKRP